MKYVEILILFLTITCMLFMTIGLIRPWAMLWWEDVQNRGKVIKVYGTLAILLGLAYAAMRTFVVRRKKGRSHVCTILSG